MQMLSEALNVTCSNTHVSYKKDTLTQEQSEQSEDFDLSDSFSAFLCTFDPFTQEQTLEKGTTSFLDASTLSTDPHTEALLEDASTGIEPPLSSSEEKLGASTTMPTMPSTPEDNILNFQSLTQRLEDRAISAHDHDTAIARDNLLKQHKEDKQSTEHSFDVTQPVSPSEAQREADGVSASISTASAPPMRTASLSPTLLLTQITGVLHGSLTQHPLKPQTLELKLIPAELGMIRIEISTDSRTPSLAFSGMPETLALIKAHAGSLIQNLTHQGVTLTEANLSFEQHEQSFQERDTQTQKDFVPSPPPTSKLQHALSSFSKLRKGLFA